MKVLLLNSSHNDLGLISGLKKLGCEIIVTGSNRGLIGEKYCDKYINADYSDKDLVLEIARREKIDRICACCNDYGVYTAAYVAERLGLPGYDSYEITCTLNNKDKFKKLAKELKLISPRAEAFFDKVAASDYVRKLNKYPLIVKPSDASAGNGIAKVEGLDDAINAIERAFEKSRNSTIVIEEFVSGTQHGFCTFLVNKKVRAICTNNEYSFINPYRVEIDTFPADNWQKAADILVPEIEMIAEHLKLVDGIFHLQYIMVEGKPYIIEVMQRAIGNMYSVLADKLNGLQWDYWEARAKLGLDCKDFPSPICQEGYYAYKTIMAERNGVIEDIIIPKEYDKYIFDKCLLKKKNEEIKNHLSEPVGLLFFMFSSREQMKHVLIDDYRCDLVKMR